MGQAKIKQIQGLSSALDAIAGIDNIVESFTTTVSDGDTGITLRFSCRETDAIQIFVNGHVVDSDAYGWKKDGSLITTQTLEAGTELVWDASVSGYALESDDIIEIRYQTNASGNYSGSGSSENLYGDSDVAAYIAATESVLAQEFKSTEDTRITTLYSNTLRKACSPLWMRKSDGGTYVGSGTFVSLTQDESGTPTDLDQGWYLTCAHNVIELVADQHQFNTDIYVGYGGNWYLQNSADIYYDGVADVALIRTGIQLTEYLKLAQVEPVTGQPVWICGFPGGYDNDSLSMGIIRDAHFNINDSAQAVDSLFLTAPGIGGNSGSAILNSKGDIVGIYTFGFGSYETLGGGANLSTITKSIEALKVKPANQRNHQKKYLGIDWVRYSPRGLAANFYPAVNAQGTTVYANILAQGCVVSDKALDSPMTGINVGDLILSATLDTGAQFTFGYENDQVTIGKLIYEYAATSATFTVIRGTTKLVEQVEVTLATYSSVSDAADYFLTGGAAGAQMSQTRWL